MIRLTEEQAQALQAIPDGRPCAINPRTGETFVLVRSDVYETVRKLIETHCRAGWDDPTLDVYEEYREGG